MRAFVGRGLLESFEAKEMLAYISPARGPPLWDDCNAQMGEGVEVRVFRRFDGYAEVRYSAAWD